MTQWASMQRDGVAAMDTTCLLQQLSTARRACFRQTLRGMHRKQQLGDVAPVLALVALGSRY